MTTSTIQQLALDNVNWLFDSFYGIMFDNNIAGFYLVILLTVGVISLILYYVNKLFGRK